jgi:hypothetical protein
MLKILLKGFIKKHGLLGAIVKIGDVAVKLTKSKKDDEAWAKVKAFVKELNA